ncbi:MAG: hypothetical protein ACK4UN_15145, partial [Limisphaerales bacterium]
MPDLLEQLWTEVINPDPDGRWMEKVDHVPPNLKGHFPDCAAALQRLRQVGSPMDLGQVSRFVRYESCFEILASLDSLVLRGQEPIKLEPLIEVAFSGGKVPRGMAEFMESLRETLSTDDDGEWLLGLSGVEHPWLSEVGSAVDRLVKAGASTTDLGQLAIWSSYESAQGTLRLLDAAGLSIPDETIGL